MKVIVSHLSGNRNLNAILDALIANSMLYEFHTTLAVNPSNPLLKIYPEGLKKELLRRSFKIPDAFVKTHPFRELARLLLQRVGLKSITRHEKGWASVDAVYQHLDKAVAAALGKKIRKQEISAVYAYEDGALETFTKAKSYGIKCIYDLPIAYWETVRRLLSEEAERLPQWSKTLAGGINDSQKKLDRKTEELKLADMVVTPGSFVANSLPEWAKNKRIITAPFGSPENIGGAKNFIQGNLYSGDKPLRVLFVGSMGQRKGLGDLFDAFKILKSKQIELIVMGSLLDSIDFYRKQFNNFIYEPTRAYEDVLTLMRSCDIFCLPSIAEGRALVLQEAMSQGLPLIITANTGGEDLVIEGQTGFLIPIRSPEKIAEKLDWFLNNKNKIPEMGKRARQHAATYTWSNYGQTVINGILADD